MLRYHIYNKIVCLYNCFICYLVESICLANLLSQLKCSCVYNDIQMYDNTPQVTIFTFIGFDLFEICTFTFDKYQ